MSYALKRAWHRSFVSALAIAIAGSVMPAHAHVHWTQRNNVTADTVALYHFSDTNTTVAAPASPLAQGLGLTVFSGATSLVPVADTPGAIFNPQGLNLPATQTLRATDTASAVDGDITIECWFKWSTGVTSATLDIGLQSGAKIRIARDASTPANDKFGVAGTHGSFIPVPEFTNWTDVGEEEAGLNEWRHLGLTIHSTGIYYDAVANHDRYSTGTVGRMFLNGHVTGAAVHTIDLSGLKVHDASGITIIMTGGGMVVDELAVWRKDWSANGATPNPFANGRGGAAVNDWLDYDGSIEP